MHCLSRAGSLYLFFHLPVFLFFFFPTSTQEEHNHHCRFNFVEVFSKFKLLLPSSVCYRWLPVNFSCIWGLAVEESQVTRCSLAYVSSQWLLKKLPIILLLYFIIPLFSSVPSATILIKWQSEVYIEAFSFFNNHLIWSSPKMAQTIWNK